MHIASAGVQDRVEITYLAVCELIGAHSVKLELLEPHCVSVLFFILDNGRLLISFFFFLNDPPPPEFPPFPLPAALPISAVHGVRRRSPAAPLGRVGAQWGRP